MSKLRNNQKRVLTIYVRNFSLRILQTALISLLFVSCSDNCESYDEFGRCEIYSGDSQTEFNTTMIGQLFLILVAGFLLLALILKIQKKLFIRKHKLQALKKDLRLQGWNIRVTANKFWRPTNFSVHANCIKHSKFAPQTFHDYEWGREIVGHGNATTWYGGKSIRCRGCDEGLPAAEV